MASREPQIVAPVNAIPWKYSNRVLLKTLLDRSDGGLGFVNQRVIVGGWVKSSKEVVKEGPQPPQGDGKAVQSGPVCVSCVEILQSRIPFFSSIVKIFGGTGAPNLEKLDSVIPKVARPSVAFLYISDGSCVASLQVAVDSSIAPPRDVLPTGTCILVEGALMHTSGHKKHVIGLEVEKILHIGKVDQDYPLAKKRLPLDSLRITPHFRPRTSTVPSVMRICSAMTSGTHAFFQNHGFIHVQVPILTTMDCEGHGEKFQVTTLSVDTHKREKSKPIKDIDGVSLEVLRTAKKEKSTDCDLR